MTESKQQKTDKRKINRQETDIAALKVLLGYYRDITETIREPFLILNNELYVVTANNAFYKKFKVRKKETENKLIYKLGNNQWEAPELRELLENILPKHRVLNNYEVTHSFPGLGTKTMLLNARQVDSKQLILLAIEDVTRIKQLQGDSALMTAGLVEQRDKSKQLSDAKDEFISMASHQLRTPATAVRQYMAMLTDGYAGKMSKKQISMLKIAYDSNERELEIIDDLLRVARLDAGKVYLVRSSYNVVGQLEDVIKDQRSALDANKHTVILNKAADDVTANIDKKLMRMVLENLLDNANKYSAEGQPITIDIKQDDEDTIIAVKDRGVGIRKQDLVKLFQRFSRIDNTLSVSAGGTGLGLYWVKKIIELHDGSIGVVSRVHHHTTFTIKLPLLEAKTSSSVRNPTKILKH